MSASVFKKILAVRASIPAIPKSEKGYNYTYQGADEVFTVVRSAMNEHGLLLFPSVTNVQGVDGSWVVAYSMTWADAESGETWSESWAMTVPQTDSKNRIDDKAMGKAGTYALRYYLLRTLQITTKDDVDNDIDAGSPDSLPKRTGALPRARKRDETPFPPRSEAQSVGKSAATDAVDWKKFHGWLNGMGLTHDDARKAVGAESLNAWLEAGNTKDELMARVQAYADAREEAA